jgi:hypothetical protein
MNFANKIVDYSEALMNKVLSLVPSASGKMLYNKWILYLMFIISLVDLTQFYMRGNTNAVMLFFAVGLLTTFFSKNMTVVLVMALALTHIVSYGTGALAEGMDGQEEEADEEEADEEEDDAADEIEDTAEGENAKKEESFSNTIGKTQGSIDETAKTVALLSKDTKDLPTQTVELLNKQKELMANMTQLQPLLKKAEDIISSVKPESFGTMRHYAEFK